jgi:hypothetical protein
MNKEFSRMQKLAGLLTENVENTDKDLNSIVDKAYAHFNTLSSSDDAYRENYIKSLGLDDDDVKTVMMKVTDKLSGDYDDTMREGVEDDVMGMEEGLKRTMRENQNQKSLRKKIREMILAEMNGDNFYDPVAEAKKDKKEDEAEDVDIENIDVTDDEMMVNDNTEENLLDLLQKAQNDAKKLGDEELVTQIGNNITFFTRRHVSNTEK